MTNEEKLAAIVDRLKHHKWEVKPNEVSILVILRYLTDLKEKSLIDCSFTITSMGHDVVSVCQEFDWKITDDDIFGFVNAMVHESERPVFAHLLMRYRDDREGLLKEFADNKTNEQ